MGVTISYQLHTTKPLINSLLKRAEDTALKFKAIADKVNIPFELRHVKSGLCIDIGGCETLCFKFNTPKQIKEMQKKEGYNYSYAVLTDEGKKELDEGYEIKRFPQNEKVYCAEFCKTQFSGNIVEHLWVAEILRAVASHCAVAVVDDEGDYYYSENIQDAVNSIAENGALIDSLMPTLKQLGWNENEIRKGNTNIQQFPLN